MTADVVQGNRGIAEFVATDLDGKDGPYGGHQTGRMPLNPTVRVSERPSLAIF